MPRRRTYVAGVASAVTALVAGCSSTDETEPASTENGTSTPTATETDTPTPTATETENATSIDEILQPPGEGASTETESPES